jgi:hypothetical protein
VFANGVKGNLMEIQKTVRLGAGSSGDDHLVSALPQSLYDGPEKEHMGRVVDIDPDTFPLQGTSP